MKAGYTHTHTVRWLPGQVSVEHEQAASQQSPYGPVLKSEHREGEREREGGGLERGRRDRIWRDVRTHQDKHEQFYWRDEMWKLFLGVMKARWELREGW